jgi:hypothetical protein
MMRSLARQPARSLFDAAFRTKVGEDALTEMLAHVLAYDSGVSTALAPLFGATAGTSSSQIVTQRRTPSGLRRVDLQVRFGGLSGHVAWVEVKDQHEEGYKQLSDLRDELDACYPGVSTRLIALAPTGHQILTSPHALPLTWQQVAEQCEAVGAARGGRHWRRTVRPTSEAAQWTLRDFLLHLERVGVTMSTEPLSPLDVLIPSRAEQLLERKDGTIATILDAAVKIMEGFHETDRWPKTGELSAWHGRVLAPKLGKSSDSVGGSLSTSARPGIRFVPTDEYDRASDPRDQPAFVAGIWFEPDEAVRAVLEDPSWRKTLSDDVLVTVADDEYGVRRLWYVGEIVAAEATLAEQGEQLGRWATKTIEEMTTLIPSPAP